MNSKKWIKILAVLCVLGVGFVGGINYLVDPYGLKSNKNKFGSYLSTMNKAELTNLKINLKADYYLIGTSRVMRINPNLIEKYLYNKKVYNVNISGSTFKENSMLATKIISNGKNFIYGFDAFSLNKNRLNEKELIKRYQTYKKALNKSVISSYYYYFSFDYTLTTFKHIIKKLQRKDLNNYYDEENKEIHSVTINGVEEHLDLSNKGNKKPYTNYELVKNENIIELAKKTSEQDIFIIYPKHFYHYILFQKYQNIENKYFNAIKTLVTNTNAKVWSFYGINKITLNNENFDENGWHFKPNISKLIFAKVFNDKNINIPKNFGTLVTKENINHHLENLRTQIKDYDLKKIVNK